MTGISGLLDGTALPEVEYAFATTDVPEGTWTVVHLQAREAMSELYECVVVLASALGALGSVGFPSASGAPEEMLGAMAAVEIRRAGLQRVFRGILRRVEDLGSTGSYRFVRVTLVPALWTLSKRTDSRIFQNLTTVAIVREVLRVAGIYQDEHSLVTDGSLAALAPREYCVQYRESDLAFVLRLLEDEGISFYFRHDGAGGETLVLADDHHGWGAAPTMDGQLVSIGDAGSATATVETISGFDWQRAVGTTGVTLRDFDFTRPRAWQDMTPSSPASVGPRAVYDYPARATITNYSEGTRTYQSHNAARLAKVRAEEHQTREHLGRGRGNVTNFTPGMTFTLAGHHREDLDQRYVLTAVEHVGEAWGDITDDVRSSEAVASWLPGHGASGGSPGARYGNRFGCARLDRLSTSVPFRPARGTPRPVVEGAQTAMVVGPAGEEIHVDPHGRIKVQFHWDRLGDNDEKSSCWVRVGQTWAGAGWGFVFIPRIGMEVIVTFLDGDPDRPLVTGTVYNGENAPPYELPATMTQSTLKTNSSPSNGGYNELRFEDRADEEEIYLRAQRDLNAWVLNNETRRVDQDQGITVGRHHTRLVRGNERVTVNRNRVTVVNANDTLTVDSNQEIEVHGPAGASVHVDTLYHLVADGGLTLECGKSRIVMTPEKITLASGTVEVLGSELVKIKGALVKINCSDGGSASGTAQHPGDHTPSAAVPQGLQQGGSPSLLARFKDTLNTDVLKGVVDVGKLPQAILHGNFTGVLHPDALRALLDPQKFSGLVGDQLGGLLTKVGVPTRISDRLVELGKGTSLELLTALKTGHKPDWHKIEEGAITSAVQVGVGEAFRPLENNRRVQNSRILTGLVRELKGVVTTSATYGVLVAAGVHDGMARDPYWQVLRQRNGAALAGFLHDVALPPAYARIQAWAASQGLHGIWQKGLDQAIQAAERGIESGVTRVLSP